ncbi:hypothetical protein AB0I30_31035 [Nocardia tengchongensis]
MKWWPGDQHQPVIGTGCLKLLVQTARPELPDGPLDRVVAAATAPSET